MKSFPTWKTITLNGAMTARDYKNTISVKGMMVGDYAKELLGKIEYSPVERKVELVLVSGEELGLTLEYSFSELVRKAESLGLSVCPAEVGPALRLQYDDQPVNEWILVLMEPVLVSDSSLEVFHVVRNSRGTHLYAYGAHPGYRFDLGARWVVCRPAASFQPSEPRASQSLNPQSSSLVPCSDRWNDAAEAYFRAKWMASSDGILFLDKWKHDV